MFHLILLLHKLLYFYIDQVLALDSSYRDAADLLEATEASHHGLDNHSSNGIYLEVGEVTDENGSASNSSGTEDIAEEAQDVGINMINRRGMETPVRESVYPQQHREINPLLLQSASFDDMCELEHTPLLGANNYNATYNATHDTHNNNLTTPQTHTINTPHTGTSHTQYTLQHRRVGESNTVRKYYAPTVIPIVQSKNSMVIVGAVLRKDLQESLNKLKKFAEVASAAPVCEFIIAIFFMSYNASLSRCELHVSRPHTFDC